MMKVKVLLSALIAMFVLVTVSAKPASAWWWGWGHKRCHVHDSRPVYHCHKYKRYKKRTYYKAKPQKYYSGNYTTHKRKKYKHYDYDEVINDDPPKEENKYGEGVVD